MKNVARECISAVVLVATLAGFAPAQTSGPSIQQALDRPVELTLAATPINEVFAKLSAASGVKFIIDLSTIEALPYGEQTRLAVTLKNVTLRRALSPMLAPQALQWTIDDNAVRVIPSDALYRLGRRATYDELRVLGVIYSAKLQPADAAGPVELQLRSVAESKDLSLVFRVEADKAKEIARADRSLPCTGAQWLDALCRGMGWTWYLQDDEIIVLNSAEQIRRQLQQTVSIRCQNFRLIDVLFNLAKTARIQLLLDPDVMNLLPSETRDNFSLVMADASIAQAFEVISGTTGLKFTPTNEGVRVEASDALKKKLASASDTGRRTPFFLRMTLPGPDGANLEVFLRADELPDDVFQAIQAEKVKMIERLRSQYGKPAPTSAPTTAPAQ
jgi:hypothetical protein